MTVLVLARNIDAQADLVVKELYDRSVPVFRTDLAAFPKSLAITATLNADGWSGSLSNEHRSVNLDDIGAIWYRHPSHFAISEQMSRPERRHAAAEARVGIAGILGSLTTRWINHPAREAAMFKPLQLDIARRCGLRVPGTLVTNDPSSVVEFAESIGGPLAGKNLTGAAMVESAKVKAAYTRRFSPTDLQDLRGVDTTAHLFQEYIERKEYEVRVTCVGSRVFAAGIHARTGPARIDFRSDYDALTYSVVEPPRAVIDGMQAFMRTFDISFGAFDFAVTDSQDWVFFECNPFGAYGWIEDALDFPITSAIADLLTGEE